MHKRLTYSQMSCQTDMDTHRSIQTEGTLSNKYLHTHTSLEQQQQLLERCGVCVCVCVCMRVSTMLSAFLPFPNISAEREVHLLIMHSANERWPPLDIQYAGNVNSCRMLKRCFHHTDVLGGSSFLSACSGNIRLSVAVAGHTPRNTCRNPGPC